MNRHEKLILLLIALVLLGRFAGFARDIYLAQTYGPHIPLQTEIYWKNVSIVFGGLVNLGAAIWLYIEARALALKSWIWALLGLFFGLIGMLLFYAVQIFVSKHLGET